MTTAAAMPLSRERPACTLCGLTCPEIPVERKIRKESNCFCCAGCAHVYDILIHLPEGPPADFKDTDIYRSCLAAGLVPRDENDLAPGPGAANFSADADFENVEMALSEKLQVRIDGMWCTACAWLIESVLKKSRGIADARVHFLSDTAEIAYLPYETGPEAVFDQIRHLGYGAAPISDADGSARESKTMLLRLGIGAILSLNIMMISFVFYYGLLDGLEVHAVKYMAWPLLMLSTPVIFYSGMPILSRARAGMAHATFSMDTLIAMGALSAYGFSVINMTADDPHLYFDTASMLITLVLLGRFIEHHARERVTAGISELYRLSRQKVRLTDEKGDLERWVAPDAVSAEDCFRVRCGEQVSVDGTVMSGDAVLDLSAITGESKPARAVRGDAVRAGSRLLEGDLTLNARGPGSDSSLQQMIRMMQAAMVGKNRTEAAADRITRFLVPAIVLLAAGTAAFLKIRGASTDTALLRAITVLVITCPCALGIAVPLAKVAALGTGRRLGILIRDARVLERMKTVDAVVLDKTGTLTRGDFRLRRAIPGKLEEPAILKILASLEADSNHYLAREVMRRAQDLKIDVPPAEDIHRLAGQGVTGRVNGRTAALGNRRLMEARQIPLTDYWEKAAAEHERNGDTVVFCGIDGALAGMLVFGDDIRKEAFDLIRCLKRRNMKVVMISGDSEATTAAVAARLGIHDFTGSALPEDKVADDPGSFRLAEKPWSWRATASMTPQPWPQPTWVWRWAPGRT